MNKSESVKELATALCKVQAEMPNPTFDTQNPFFKSRYASLANVRNTAIPVLSKHGMSVSQFLRGKEAGVECETMLLHSSGEWMSDSFYVPVTKHDAQGYGSAGTYARRYSLMAILGIVGDEDDDAQAAVGQNKGRKQAEEKHATSQPSPQSVPPAAAGGVPLSASQERLIRAKLSAAKLTEDALMAEYKEWSLTPKEGRVLVPKGAVNEILEWIEGSKPI